jgi:hypothetical protein
MDVKWPKLSRIEKTEVIKAVKRIGGMPILYSILHTVLKEDRKRTDGFTLKNSLDANRMTEYDALVLAAKIAYNGDVGRFLQVWKDNFNKDKEDDQQR